MSEEENEAVQELSKKIFTIGYEIILKPVQTETNGAASDGNEGCSGQFLLAGFGKKFQLIFQLFMLVKIQHSENSNSMTMVLVINYYVSAEHCNTDLYDPEG